MTVLDTFYLLFKSNAKEAAQDTAALDKEMSKLEAKGKQRSDAETKQLKELRKQRTEVTRDIKDQTREVDKLGQSFVKTLENLAAAGTALVTFSALKAGVQHVTDFNSALQVTARIMGQNPTMLAVLGGAAQHLGGTQEGAIAGYQSLFNWYSAHGLKTADPLQLVAALRRDLAKRSTPEGKAQLLQQLGISDTGLIGLGEASEEDYQAAIRQGSATSLDDGQREKLRALKQQEADTSQELSHAFGVLGAELSDVIIPALKGFGDFLHLISDKDGGSSWHERLANWIDGKMHGDDGAFRTPLRIKVPAGDAHGDQSALEFWMSQGYTREQAAGIAGNEFAESSGNPNARNYSKGTHYGLYQWSDARRARIKAALGIDVATASADDQRRAAAWELQDRGDDSRIKATSTSAESAAAFNRYFEVSGENPARRARLAAMIAGGQSPDVGGYGATASGGRSLSVKIDAVNVHTQATDAQGIASGVGSALQSQIRTAISGWDDGIAQ